MEKLGGYGDLWLPMETLSFLRVRTINPDS